MGQRGAMLDELYGSLKDLSVDDLKGMLVDDVKLQSYFEANIPSVKEKQELVREIRSVESRSESLRPVVYSSLIGFTSCIVKVF